jgi:GntR family transcriptional regulator
VTPGFREIASELQARIESGELPPGATPIRRRGTVVRDRRPLTFWASRSEASERRASSTADAYVTDVLEAGRTPTQVFECSTAPATPAIATLLGMEVGTEVIVRLCLRSVDEAPWSIQESFYPQDLVDLLPELASPQDIARGTTTALQEVGVYQVGFADELTARMPTAREQEFFQLGRGVPVIVQTRTAYTVTRPVRVTTTTFAGDRNRILYEVGNLTALYNTP